MLAISASALAQAVMGEPRTGRPGVTKLECCLIGAVIGVAIVLWWALSHPPLIAPGSR
jgi:hypothetical protein